MRNKHVTFALAFTRLHDLLNDGEESSAVDKTLICGVGTSEE